MSITAFRARTRLEVSATTKRRYTVGLSVSVVSCPPLRITINDVWVKGWPWNTFVFVRWDGAATLANGDASYVNRGLHVFSLRWGRVYAIEEFYDSQAAALGLVAQAAAGIEEAVAEQITS